MTIDEHSYAGNKKETLDETRNENPTDKDGKQGENEINDKEGEENEDRTYEIEPCKTGVENNETRDETDQENVGSKKTSKEDVSEATAPAERKKKKVTFTESEDTRKGTVTEEQKKQDHVKKYRKGTWIGVGTETWKKIIKGKSM